MKNNFYYLFLFFLCSGLLQAQDTLPITKEVDPLVIIKEVREPYNPLAPSKAAFYSAVVPGLGQAYNEKYWKIPIVYAGIGIGIYFYIDNNNEYHRFRDAYKRRLAGYTDDEFQGIASETLIRAQRTARRNKDVSIAVAVGFYLLNIVDANVDAHLRQFDVSEDLSFRPNVDFTSGDSYTNYGFSLTYQIRSKK